MIPVHHHLCNRVINPAPGDEGKVNPLPIRFDPAEGFTSYWRPSPTEIEMLQKGALITQTIVSNRLPPSSIRIMEDDGRMPELMSSTDVAMEVCAALDELSTGAGEWVSVHQNEGTENQPRCLITCQGDWTGWEEKQFASDHALDCLRAAVMEKRIWAGRNPNGLEDPPR